MNKELLVIFNELRKIKPVSDMCEAVDCQEIYCPNCILFGKRASLQNFYVDLLRRIPCVNNSS